MNAKFLSISLIAVFYALCIILIQGTFAISQAQTKNVRVPILTYHYIRTVTDKKDILGARLSVTPAVFEDQLKKLQKEGYQTITLDNLAAAWEGTYTLPSKPIIMTFDDGYDDFYINAYPLLKKYNFQATAYIVPNFINKPHYMTLMQVKELSQSRLITIGAHTMSHLDLRTKNNKITKQEIIGSKEYLEHLIGMKVQHFAYPYGKYTENTIKIVKEAKFTTATTMARGMEHEEKNRFSLTREEIIGGDSLKKFEKSVLYQ